MPGEARARPEASDPERGGGAAPPATGAAHRPRSDPRRARANLIEGLPEIPSGSEAVTHALLPGPTFDLFAFEVAVDVSAAPSVTVGRWHARRARREPSSKCAWPERATGRACRSQSS